MGGCCIGSFFFASGSGIRADALEQCSHGSFFFGGRGARSLKKKSVEETTSVAPIVLPTKNDKINKRRKRDPKGEIRVQYPGNDFLSLVGRYVAMPFVFPAV